MARILLFRRSVLLPLLFSVSFIVLITFTFRKLTSVNKSRGDTRVWQQFQQPVDNFRTLHMFSSITEKFLNFCIIEPTVLWRLIPHDHELLRRKRFDLSRHLGHEKIVTLAMYEEDIGKLLNNAVLKTNLERFGFQRWILKSRNSSSVSGGISGPRNVTSHIMYVKNNVVLHVVVFREEEKYLWTWKLETNSLVRSIEFKNFVFGQTDAMFDRFQMIPYEKGKQRMKNIFVPLDIKAFLFQLDTARYVSCKSIKKVSPDITTQTPKQIKGKRPLRKFIETTQAVITVLKSILDPSLTKFWLACGTLLGWRRECGLIPFTHDVDFGAWATDLDENLIATFRNSSKIKMRYALGTMSEDLELWLRYEWLLVDLFFVYDRNDSTEFHVGAHRPDYGYSFKYIYPKFELCSTDFLTYRVLVPCDPEPVIEAEYGKDWNLPKEHWNYEMSARNVLGRRYWPKSEIQNFEDYIHGVKKKH